MRRILAWITDQGWSDIAVAFLLFGSIAAFALKFRGF